MDCQINIEDIKIGKQSLKKNEKYGFYSISPLPKREELLEFYKNEFYDTCKDYYIKKQLEDNHFLNSIFKTFFNRFKKYNSKTKGKLLDIGCGAGFFLEFMQNHNWTGIGIELSDTARNFAQEKGLKVYSCEFNKEFIEKSGKFDLIYLNEVLEHLYNPEEIIINCSNALEEEGMLYISVPNDFNPFQMILIKNGGYRPWWVSPQEHLHYFSFESLSKLLKAHKFKILDTYTSFPIDIFLLMGKNYVETPSVGTECHNLRKNFEDILIDSGYEELLEQIYESFAKLNLGRHVKILAQKTA